MPLSLLSCQQLFTTWRHGITMCCPALYWLTAISAARLSACMQFSSMRSTATCDMAEAVASTKRTSLIALYQTAIWRSFFRAASVRSRLCSSKCRNPNGSVLCARSMIHIPIFTFTTTCRRKKPFPTMLLPLMRIYLRRPTNQLRLNILHPRHLSALSCIRCQAPMSLFCRSFCPPLHRKQTSLLS